MSQLIQSTDKSVLLKNQVTLERKINHLQNLYCLLKSEQDDGGEEEDPIFTASPAFGISSGDIVNWNDAVSLSHEHFNMGVLNGISSTNVTNWNSAYTATQNLSNNYFPLQGGTLTGTGGNGSIGFPNQSSTPTNPADGFKLYANAGNNPTFQKFNGVLTELSFVNTASRTYTFPDVTGEVLLTTGTQTISGTKTFTGGLTIPATTVTGNITVSSNNNRTIGDSTNKFLQIYSAQFLGTAATVFGTEGSTGNVLFRQGTTLYVGGFIGTTGNFFLQAASGTVPTDTGERLQVIGTSRLGGNVTVAGSVNPDGDATRNLGSQTARWQLFVSTLLKGNNTNGMNFAGATGSDVFLRFQPTTHNAVFQNAGAGIAETGYRVTIDGTSATNGAFQVTNGAVSLGGNTSITGNLTMSGQILPDGDNTRTLGSSTLRMSTVYAIHVSKGNIGNSFNLAVTNTTDIYMRVQATTNNFVFQQAGTAPAETGYKVAVDGTGAGTGALLITNGNSNFGGDILANSNDTRTLGSASNRWLQVYTGIVRGAGTLRFTAGASNGFVFSQTADTNTIAQFFATTGALGLQSPANLMTDDGVNRLQVAGSIKATQYRLSALNTAPTSATDTGTLGEIRIDANFIYVATATNTWKRAAIATW